MHVKSMVTRVTTSNMVAIPSAVRHDLGIRPKDALEWHTFGEFVVLLPVRAESSEELLSLLSGMGSDRELAQRPSWEE